MTEKNPVAAVEELTRRLKIMEEEMPERKISKTRRMQGWALERMNGAF